MSDCITSARAHRIGHVQLNRPAAFNALNQDMIRALFEVLSAWRDDPAVHAVVITGAGGRAFCAGGDIRALRDAALAGNGAAIETFFAEEYALNRLIAEYPKPYVALIDGICMGGGIGVSVHGQIRVASEAAIFAMPETGIGLFPDVGASYVLPRLPGALGMYLGLTGARMTGADAVHAGFATHFVPQGRFAPLLQAATQNGVAALPAFAELPPPFTLAPHMDAINRCFAAESVSDIFARLEQEGAWGEQTLQLLRKASPSALCWSFGLLQRGARRTLPQALQAELKLTRAVTAHPDFVEGVRAMIIDKDRMPRWSPASLGEVDARAIDAMLA